jgi:competence protein ComEA
MAAATLEAVLATAFRDVAVGTGIAMRVVMLYRIIAVARRIAAWVWAPVAVKLLMGAGAFAALAHVGAGTMAHLPAANAGTVRRDIEQAALPAAASAKPDCSARAAPGAWGDDGRLHLNHATAEDLMKLPGIGRKRADAIVDLRTRLGGFRRLRDLMRVRGIGPRSMQKLAPLLTLEERAPTKAKPSPSAAPRAARQASP